MHPRFPKPGSEPPASKCNALLALTPSSEHSPTPQVGITSMSPAVNASWEKTYPGQAHFTAF